MNTLILASLASSTAAIISLSAETMSKYDFIKNGNTLYWNDPDNGESSGTYQVISVPEEIDDDSIILIASDHSETEVFPFELSPIGMTMDYKKDFLRWKAESEVERMFFVTAFPKSSTRTRIWQSAIE